MSHWPEEHPLKNARSCPWCGATPSPEGTGLECRHELPLQAIERTLRPDGYPDPAKALLWLNKTGQEWDAQAFWVVSHSIGQWNLEAILRRNARRFNLIQACLLIAAGVLLFAFVLYPWSRS